MSQNERNYHAFYQLIEGHSTASFLDLEDDVDVQAATAYAKYVPAPDAVASSAPYLVNGYAEYRPLVTRKSREDL